MINHLDSTVQIKITNLGHAPPSKERIMRYLHQNPDKVREVLLKEGMLSAPAPLPKLHDRYYDEL